MTTTVRPANHGEVFTRRWVVDTILDLVGYTADRRLYETTLIEPAVGAGAFLIPAVERLLASAARDGVGLARLADAVRGYDVQEAHVSACRAELAALLARHGYPGSSDIVAQWVQCDDFLLVPGVAEADFVVGNPPYIRTEDLDDRVEAEYRRRWSTMRGRADIYVGFYERGLSLLKPGGKLGFICADRWMRNQYGGSLRRFVTSGYAVEHVWSMHDVDAFEADVAAYPAITVLAREPQGSAVVVDTAGSFGRLAARSVVRWSESSQSDSLDVAGASAFRMPGWFEGSGFWPTGSRTRLQLVEYLVERHSPMHDPGTGTRVSIGVASGADSVFIVTDESLVEHDRLLPISMVSDLGEGQFRWGGRYLVNPWGDDGLLVDPAEYPKMMRYLERHAAVRARFVARQNPQGWYRTIDKVHPHLVDRQKLLLQDMRASINPVLEGGGHYPHHNLYYVTSEEWDMEVLGGLLLSRIAQAFVEAFCVRMRGGTLRFQAQYLKKLPVPQPGLIDPGVQTALRRAFRSRDVGAATLAAGLAYGIDPAAYGLAGPDSNAGLRNSA